MLKRSAVLLLIAFFTASIPQYAQEEKTNNDDEEFFWDRWGKSDWFSWKLRGNPFIEISYGFSQTSHNSFDTKFNDLGFGEAKFGYRDIYEDDTEYLLTMDEDYISFSMLKKDFLSKGPSLSKWNAEFLRFGFGNSDGIGYKIGVAGIIPYYSGGFGWTSLRKIEYNGIRAAVVTPEDEMLAYIGDDFRFGRNVEGGVKFELASTISLNAGYEASVIFPRYMFWYWAGSALIEEAGMGIVDHFIHKIKRSSPAAAPVVNFVLKNAYAYVFYLLKKDRMNWPFETAAPMTIETFKLGLTFTF